MRWRIGGAALVFMLAGSAGAQLSGSYTIDPNGSGPRNYTTISAAVKALGAGVTGPVTFDLASVVFKEWLYLNPVPGASSSNTITFQAVGSPAILDPGTGGSTTLHLSDGTAWFRFTNLEIRSVSQSCLYLLGVSSGPGVHDNVFTRVHCDAAATTNLFIHALRLMAARDNRFLGCTFRGGGETVVIEKSTMNVLDGCEMDGKGKANCVVYFINTSDADNVLQNSFLHNSTSGSSCVLNVNACQHGNMIFNNTILCKTAGTAVQIGGIEKNWAAATGFKNNIVVNLGSGALMWYQYLKSDTLEPFVSDSNCYYCPGNPKYLHVLGYIPSTTLFQGNLAAFKTWQQKTPSPIWPGGPGMYDANSLEADPGLVSMTAPFDIHLVAGSPLIDRGTSRFVEPYQTFNPNHKVTADFEGHPRGTRIDIGADEAVATLTGSGATQPGSSLTLDLFAPGDAGLLYQVGSSLGPGPIPIDSRWLGLSLDGLLDVSVNGYWPGVFSGYRGWIDGSGKARALIHIPAIQALIGARIHSAFVTLDPGAPSCVRSVSNTFLFSVTR